MKTLHKNNKHLDGYDFDLLVKSNPDLEEFIIKKFEKSTIDFSDSKAVKELNKSLLKEYYQINYWDFPKDNLCPPVPGRVDYLHHLADLLDVKENISVLDIGTGASLIYPLLGVSEFNWKFVATDINTKSLSVADKIIVENDLSDSISLRLQKDRTHILEGIIQEKDRFTFTMCNPPFYKDIEDAQGANSRKNRNLGTAQQRNFSGNIDEICYKGGEKAFLHTYLYESSKFPESSEWFTSLVSKKDNVKSLEASAKKLKAKEFKVVGMQQGNKTTRIVCWKF